MIEPYNPDFQENEGVGSQVQGFFFFFWLQSKLSTSMGKLVRDSLKVKVR